MMRDLDADTIRHLGQILPLVLERKDNNKTHAHLKIIKTDYA